jgi:hypothetical protein
MGTELGCYFIVAFVIPLFATAALHLSPGAQAVVMLSLCLVPAVVAALFRGGPVFWLTRIDVIRNDGRPAGRFRCAWRNLIAWAGLILPYGWLASFIGAFPPSDGTANSTPAGEMYVDPVSFLVPMCGAELLGLLFLIGAVWAVVQPRRGLQDWLAGTCLIPR